MKIKLVLTILTCFLGIKDSNGQGTLQITFDDPPRLPGPGESFSVQHYSEAGMSLTPLGAAGPGNTFGRQRGGGQLSFASENGTAYITTALTQSLQFSFADGSLFALLSVDLAEYSTVVPDAVTVAFIGYRQDGSTVNAAFTTDGIIDGTGPLADFETFNFDQEWRGLARVEIPTWGWSLDNLVVVIPEPGSTALLLVGGGICIWLRRSLRRRSKSNNSNP